MSTIIDETDDLVDEEKEFFHDDFDRENEVNDEDDVVEDS